MVMPNSHPLGLYAAHLLLNGPDAARRYLLGSAAMNEFTFVTDRADLRYKYDRWWVYFSERTGMHVAIKNPRPELDEDGWTVAHDGVAELPEFADTREYWTHGWHTPVLAPTISDEAGDEYDAEVYDALREADFST